MISKGVWEQYKGIWKKDVCGGVLGDLRINYDGDSLVIIYLEKNVMFVSNMYFKHKSIYQVHITKKQI